MAKKKDKSIFRRFKKTVGRVVSAPWKKGKKLSRIKKERPNYNKLFDYITRQANKGSEMHQHMLKRVKDYLNQGMDFNTAVKRAMAGGHVKYAWKRQKEAEAAGDIEKVEYAKKLRGHSVRMAREGEKISYVEGGKPPKSKIFCLECRKWYDRSKKECPHCGTPNPKYEEITPLSETAGKRVKGKLYEIFIFEIAGILSIFIPPIFGLPSLTWLAYALMLFIPAYVALPSQSQVVRSIEEGRTLSLKSVSAGSLMAKSFMKICAFALIIYQFYIAFTVFRLICVIIAFIFYFSLPTRYETSQPYKFIEAWFRMFLGIFIALILYLTFGSFGAGSVGLTFFLMGIAFFFTLPMHIESKERNIIQIKILKDSKENKGFQYLDKTIFSIMMLIALFTLHSVIPFSFEMNSIIIYAFFALSFFVGFTTGPEGRPVLGIIMVFLMLFALTSTYPGYVGQAVFGYWWPQMVSFGETYLDPLNDLWYQAQSGLSDTWLMLTNPQQYYLEQQKKQQAAKSVITRGGTPMSIEINKLELIPSIPGILEPTEPVIGNMELQNKGDFTSGEINLDLWTMWVNATSLEEFPTGAFDNLYCSHQPSQYPQKGSSSNVGETAFCHWIKNRTYPTEMRSITFKLREDDWDFIRDGSLDDECQWFSGATGETEDCSCPCDLINVTYKHSGTTVKVKANLTYQYTVNVSMPINIMGFESYLNKLQAGEIILKDLTSEYTGGPVKATLWTPKQPARTDIPFLVVASIYNDGPGELLNITDFDITIYGGNAIEDVTVIGETFRISPPNISKTPDGCVDDATKEDDKWVISCDHTYEGDILERGKYKRVSFYIHPKSGITDEITTQIVGWADYTYRKTKSQMLQVANAPPQ